MNAKLIVSAAALAASFIAVPAFAQVPAAPAAPGALPTTMNPQANQAVNNIRQQWDAARNALIQARNNANGARQNAARAEQAEAQALQNFERANMSLIGVLLATTNRPPVPQPLMSLAPQLPPPNLPQGQPVPGQPAQPPRP